MAERLIRLSVVIAAVAAVMISPGVGAKSPLVPSLCTRLTTQIRHSPESVIKDPTSPSPNWQPWVVSADPNQPLPNDVYRRIAATWRSQIGSLVMQGIETLPKADLFMAFSHPGALHCLSPIFFAGKTGDTLHVVGAPPDATFPCAMSDQSDGALAMVLGQPTYIESGPLAPNSTDSSLLVVPW
jgi:hypothetical protein